MSSVAVAVVTIGVGVAAVDDTATQVHIYAVVQRRVLIARTHCTAVVACVATETDYYTAFSCLAFEAAVRKRVRMQPPYLRQSPSMRMSPDVTVQMKTMTQRTETRPRPQSKMTSVID
jgi:hypothetical protein